MNCLNKEFEEYMKRMEQIKENTYHLYKELKEIGEITWISFENGVFSIHGNNFKINLRADRNNQVTLYHNGFIRKRNFTKFKTLNGYLDNRERLVLQTEIKKRELPKEAFYMYFSSDLIDGLKEGYRLENYVQKEIK